MSALKLIARFTANGLSYHEYALVKDSLAVGREVFLKAVVGNPHDAHAISVNVKTSSSEMGEEFDSDASVEKEVQIGWVPKTFASKELLWRLLSMELNLRSKIVLFDPNSGSMGQVVIGVWLEVVE